MACSTSISPREIIRIPGINAFVRMCNTSDPSTFFEIEIIKLLPKEEMILNGNSLRAYSIVKIMWRELMPVQMKQNKRKNYDHKNVL